MPRHTLHTVMLWTLLPVALAACGAADGVSASAPPATDAPAPAATAAPVTELPLQRGYYVEAATACGDASQATLALVRRDGISACTFERLEPIGPDRYRALEQCSDPQAGSFQLTQAYAVLAPDRYRVTFEHGGSAEFRYCAQRTLPAWLHDNDISDVTG